LIVSGENALSSLQVVEAAYRSQETGAPVMIDTEYHRRDGS
jgi:hypothetical protein